MSVLFFVVVFLAPLFAVGAAFLKLIFLHNVASIRARHVFAVVFALSGGMFAAVLCELGGLFDPFTRLLALWSCLSMLLCLVVFVIPLIAVRSLLDDFNIKGVKGTVLALALIGLTLLISARIIPTDDASIAGIGVSQQQPKATAAPSAASSVDAEEEGGTLEPAPQDVATDVAAARNYTAVPLSERLTLLEAVLCRAACYGVTFMAILGGYAAVATPTAYLLPFFMRHRKDAAQSLVTALTRRQQFVVDRWIERRRALAFAQCKRQQHAETQSRTRAVLTWLQSAVGRGEDAEIVQLTAECDGIERVSAGLFFQLHEAAEARQMAYWGDTWRGAFFAFLGAILSLYCVGKVVLTSLNLLLRRFSTVDPLTRSLTIFVGVTDVDLHVPTLVSRIALTFNGIIIVSAIRGF